MFSTLLASGAVRTAESRGAVPSVLLHAGVILSMIVATQATDPLLDEPRESRIVPLMAPRMATPRPAAPATPRTPTASTAAPEVPKVPVEVPAVPIEVPTGIVTDPTPAPFTGGEVGDPNALPSADPGIPIGSPNGTALDADAVDVPVRMRANSPLPRYPDVLRQSRVPGFVRVRFVVGPDGRAEMNTVEIVEESHAAFGQAVRNVLPRLRFTPARVGPRAVRQVVEIPFGFELR